MQEPPCIFRWRKNIFLPSANITVTFSLSCLVMVFYPFLPFSHPWESVFFWPEIGGIPFFWHLESKSFGRMFRLDFHCRVWNLLVLFQICILLVYLKFRKVIVLWKNVFFFLQLSLAGVLSHGLQKPILPNRSFHGCLENLLYSDLNLIELARQGSPQATVVVRSSFIWTLWQANTNMGI